VSQNEYGFPNVSGGTPIVIINTVITTAISGVVFGLTTGLYSMKSLNVVGALTYGSGGTTIKAWIQTSLDGGLTWFDVANMAFTTASASKIVGISAYAGTVLASSAVGVGTDAGLADNTVIQGVLGDRFRMKLTTTGTYAGNTILNMSAMVKG